MIRLAVPRSQRDQLYWQIHVTLDHARTTSEFAELLLTELGVDRAALSKSPHADVAHALRTRLPAVVDEIDVALVAAILEEHGLLSWVDDVRPGPAAIEETLERAVTDLLRSFPPGTRPRQATAELMAEVSRLLGTLVDAQIERTLGAAILDRLECDLWRRKTEEKMLVGWLCHDVMTHARLR